MNVTQVEKMSPQTTVVDVEHDGVAYIVFLAVIGKPRISIGNTVYRVRINTKLGKSLISAAESAAKAIAVQARQEG